MRRLCQDPDQPASMRADLLRSQLAGCAYPIDDRLVQLRAALSDATRMPLAESSRFADIWRSTPLFSMKVIMPFAAAAFGVALGLRPHAEHERRPIDSDARLQAIAAPSESRAEVSPPPAVPTRTADLHPLNATNPSESPASNRASTGTLPRAARFRDSMPETSSRREIAQLVRIRALLARDPNAAYRLAQRSEREFPQGLLSEEREALSILALAKSGAHAAAVAKARDHQARFPESTMRGVIQAALQPTPTREGLPASAEQAP